MLMYSKTLKHRKKLSISAKKAYKRMSLEKRTERAKKISSTKRKNNKNKYEVRTCVYDKCDNIFKCLKSSDKKYCSHQCSLKTKLRKGTGLRIKEVRFCHNPSCFNFFECWVEDCRKFCCSFCANEIITKSKKRNRKTQNAVTEFWQDSERKQKRIKTIMRGAKRKSPNIPKRKLGKFLQKLFPNQWKYVGSGAFILAGKCPDFVNINGQKKIIEMFGDYWHGEGKTGIPNKQHEQERIDVFVKEGYQTLIIWQHELKDIEKLKYKLREFNNNVGW